MSRRRIPPKWLGGLPCTDYFSMTKFQMILSWNHDLIVSNQGIEILSFAILIFNIVPRFFKISSLNYLFNWKFRISSVFVTVGYFSLLKFQTIDYFSKLKFQNFNQLSFWIRASQLFLNNETKIPALEFRFKLVTLHISEN